MNYIWWSGFKEKEEKEGVQIGVKNPNEEILIL